DPQRDLFNLKPITDSGTRLVFIPTTLTMYHHDDNPLAKYRELTPIQSTRDQAPTNVSGVLKHGYISVKEEGLKAFIWSKRYMTLRELTLSFHRNE
ncbi:hypothetical protein BGZ94_005980, partial [Podila epigama]